MGSNTSIKSSPRHAKAAKVGDVVGTMRRTKSGGFVGESNLQVDRILPSGRLVLSHVDGSQMKRYDGYGEGRPIPAKTLYPAEDQGGRVAWKESNKDAFWPKHFFIRTAEDAKAERKEERRHAAANRRYEAKMEAKREKHRPTMEIIKTLAGRRGLKVHGTGDRLALGSNDPRECDLERQDRDLADFDSWEDVNVTIRATDLLALLADADRKGR